VAALTVRRIRLWLHQTIRDTPHIYNEKPGSVPIFFIVRNRCLRLAVVNLGIALFLTVGFELLPVQGLILGPKLGILPLQNPHPLLAGI
jgi:hypothetical protein